MKNFKFLAIILITGFLIGCPRGGVYNFDYGLYLDGPKGEKVTVQYSDNESSKKESVELPAYLHIHFTQNIVKHKKFSDNNPVIIEANKGTIVQGVLAGEQFESIKDIVNAEDIIDFINACKNNEKYKEVYKITTESNNIMEFKYFDADIADDLWS